MTRAEVARDIAWERTLASLKVAQRFTELALQTLPAGPGSAERDCAEDARDCLATATECVEERGA